MPEQTENLGKSNPFLDNTAVKGAAGGTAAIVVALGLWMATTLQDINSSLVRVIAIVENHEARLEKLGDELETRTKFVYSVPDLHKDVGRLEEKVDKLENSLAKHEH